VTCGGCGGSGKKPLFTSVYVCDECHGTGAVFGPCEGINPGEPGYEEARVRQMKKWREELKEQLK
jgi:DnaJ-class molecular chaperone